MSWILAEPIISVCITAAPEGVYIRHENSNLKQSLENAEGVLLPLGKWLPLLVPQLLEQGYAYEDSGAICIPYDQFVSLNEDGISAFDNLAPFSPFYIELSTSGTLGRNDFSYKIKYFHGLNPVAPPERIGCFVKHLDKIFRLDNQTFYLLEKVQQYRQMPPEVRESPQSLVNFADIRGLAEGVGAQIDQFIKTNKVLIPPAIGIDLIEEQNGRISFAPFIDGVPDENLKRAFLQANDVTDLFVDDGTGGRVRLIFSDEQQEALRRMSKVRHLGGQEKTKALRNPTAIFDGVAAAIDMDMGDFGPRVRGIGSFPFISMPVIQRSDTGIFDDSEFPGTSEHHGAKLNAAIICKYADGTEEKVGFNTKQELIDFNQQVQSAYSSGIGVVNFNDRSIVVDEDFARGMSEVIQKLTAPRRPKPPVGDQSDKKYLLIYENDESLEYEEKWALERIDIANLSLPSQLRPDIDLKPHQLEGLCWLQTNYLLEGKNGCLLADDMGLGKTLQVLAFAAWLIEYEKFPDDAPWKPILIVAPVMLIENETWIQDIIKFFQNDGSIFTPWYVLHGQNLRNMRTPGITGQEVTAQKPLLDLERLRQYRVIFTNYETIVNYQFSFASMKSDWSLVVTDEAQAQKTPKTKISHALKSLSPRFRIACTGTPVETRLLDVWNIMDYLQPGELLGSATDFSRKYEQPLADANTTIETKKILETLKHRIHFGRPTSFILRREKSDSLKGLPKKTEHKIECDLSQLQREYHLDYMRRARQGTEHPFALIQGLMKLYQHPALIPKLDPQSLDDFSSINRDCPKLLEMLKILETIRRNREKALIFTRSLDMQQLLATSIFKTFGQRVDIVNGAASKKETATSSGTRKSMINRFRHDDNLTAIILSPEVAGFGLTLVEANHVIHYGRWWNPAKESQATDRAYRIGQDRDVNVYQLIAKDPRGEFKSFDEKLDSLIERRRKMAMDFLAPMPAEEELQKEFYKDLFDDSTPDHGVQRSIKIDDVRGLPWERFESLVAVLEQKAGTKVLLTPQSGDMGIDVVSISGRQARLIQCKHRRYEDEVESDVISELINAFDTYRSRFFSGTEYSLTPVLATNGKLSQALRNQCRQREIEVLSGTSLAELLERRKCSHADIEFMEATRIKTMKQFADIIFQG